MKEKIKKFNILKKLSLVQQLLVVLGIVGLLVFVIMIPIVDQNLRSIIDDQMYETLEIEQDMIINNSFMPSRQNRRAYHIIYDSLSNTVISTNLSSQETINNFYYYVFGEPLQTLINQPLRNSIENKSELQSETYYCLITHLSDSQYLISIQNSDYTNELITTLRNQTIYIQYAFFILFALVMIAWVLSLINPLKKIKNYIDMIKERKDATLMIDREDEIGIVSKALVEMKEDLDRQEKIKEEMIHNISHDLKTPIALIQTYAQSIKDDVYPYGDKDSSVDVILENTNRLEKKVRSLLYLNRLDYLSGQVGDEVCSMKELIEHIVYQLNAMHPDIEIITELQDTYFKGDEEYWRICIENIIENASRYVNHTIKVILKNQYLEIFNDGESIDNSNPESLFQPYEIGHKGQFGLGLSIVYKTVTMYGFKVEALNKEDGVSFVIHK